MRFLTTVLFSLLTTLLFGQSVDSLGLDNNPLLTKHESDYLNSEFKSQRAAFDFDGKKVAFVTGSLASRHIKKAEYFNDVKAWAKDNQSIVDFPVFLTNEEKIKSGGYDVIMMAWVKVLTERRRGQIINELKAASR